ncbi:MAG: hypothetical protein HQ508_01550 [Candidatus Marinimicrobia bacterium]|nr:hypothetical protein [Candidatus Neomarinimicrobiota bacterium]
MILNPLFCPITKRPLVESNIAILDAVNSKIQHGDIAFQSGGLVTELFDALLVETQMNIAYPIKNGIPQLIPLLSVSLEGLNSGISFD